MQTELWLAEIDVKGEARPHFDLMKAEGVSWRAKPNETDWSTDALDLPLADIIIDGLLGTGTSGPPHGVIGAAVNCLRSRSREALIVSIDVPSGLNADSGEAYEPCIRADWTITLGLPKIGFLNPESWDFTGSIEAVDIGIPAKLIDHVKTDAVATLIHEGFVREVLPPRPRETHKGTYGRALLIGGSRGLTGAISMAAQAAVVSGAGLVTVYTPVSVASAVAANCPEAMVHAYPESEEGTLKADLIDELKNEFSSYQAILIGPGLGAHAEMQKLVRGLLRSTDVPVVLDADALNVFEGRPHWVDSGGSQTVLTPHPGELARLLGVDLETVLMDRNEVVANTADMTGSIVALKGAGTIVSDGTRRRMINLTGNPGMATGGTGDVLAGMIAGLLAQGLDACDATAVAVYLHGKTGDLVAARTGHLGLKATDLIDALPATIRFVL
ncbi:MAG: hydroxyethylthiazole kinase-like uncharacterized protein yjeF [Verrucomicrobiales bacterium]